MSRQTRPVHELDVVGAELAVQRPLHLRHFRPREPGERRFQFLSSRTKEWRTLHYRFVPGRRNLKVKQWLSMKKKRKIYL